MKKNLNFPIEEKEKNIAKRNARLERKFFSDYSEEAYLAGVALKDFCRKNLVTPNDVIFFLENSINATQIKAAQR